MSRDLVSLASLQRIRARTNTLGLTLCEFLLLVNVIDKFFIPDDILAELGL